MTDSEKRARAVLAHVFACDPAELSKDEVRTARAVLACLAALTPPKGYVLVPVEPTAEMLTAAAFGVAGKSGQKFKPMMSAGYAAMIAARPEVSGG